MRDRGYVAPPLAGLSAASLLARGHAPMGRDQRIFAARFVSIDEAARHGAEWVDAGRGGYEVRRVPLDRVREIDLRPAELRAFVADNVAALLDQVFG